MVHRKASQLLVVCLVVLLGAQLTGLSCLGEWRLASSAESGFDTLQITGDGTGVEEPADDGCPCHLAFVSIPVGAYHVSHPASLNDPDSPVTAPLAPPFSFFHPPLSL